LIHISSSTAVRSDARTTSLAPMWINAPFEAFLAS